MSPARKSFVTIDLAQPCRAWAAALPRAASRCRRAAEAALAVAGPDVGDADRAGAELSIVLGDDALLRRLNRAWRGKDAATNVLSFPAQRFAAGALQPAAASAAGAPLLLGDVVLGFETVRREADEQGKAIGDHLAHLVVHGVLHLLGFDHEAAPDAERMEEMERRALSGLGVADPYAMSDAMAEAPHG
jgi:probable rRNA maturation factor